MNGHMRKVKIEGGNGGVFTVPQGPMTPPSATKTQSPRQRSKSKKK